MQGELFNAEESENRKKDGMDRAEGSLPMWLTATLADARSVGKMLSLKNGSVTTDDVGKYYEERGVDISERLGPAMGSMFKGRDWEWTGEFKKSERVKNHCRLLRVWRWVGVW